MRRSAPLILTCLSLAILVGCPNPTGSTTSTNKNSTYSNGGGTIAITFVVNGTDTVKTFNFNLGGVNCTKTTTSISSAPTLPVNVNDQFSITNMPGSPLALSASVGYSNPGITLKSYSISAKLQ